MSLEQHLSKYCSRLVCKDVSKTNNAKQDIHVHVNEIKTLEKKPLYYLNQAKGP